MTFIYFGAKHAVYVHDEIIRCSGGLLGILNLGLIESSLEHIQNDFYYPEMEHKLRHLFFSINKNHAFQDGNKRASIALSAYFLEINNYSFKVDRFIKDTEKFAVDVADNYIDKALLLKL